MTPPTVQSTGSLPPLQPVSPALAPSYRDPDEINLLEYAYVLVKNKWWILGAGVLGVVLGLALAYIKGPRFEATVLIAPREAEAQKTPSLSGFGAFGGLLASQLAFGTTPGLDRIETILGTRQFNAEMVTRYGLLPDIYKEYRRKAFRTWYDASARQWKPGFQPPVMAEVGGFLAAKVIKRQTGKNSKNLTVSLSTRDSLLSCRLLSSCIEYLNTYIRDNIQQDAQTNVHYLDSALTAVADPLVREKVQGLIAAEIEKMMVVSKEAFQVVDPVVVGRDFRHRTLYPLALGFGLCVLSVLWLVFAHAFAGAEKRPEDAQYLAGLRRELWPWSRTQR